MYEQAKIDEAQYFLLGMVREKDIPKHFIYELSAFLSAARSVLQYALKEAELKVGGRNWYDQHMQDRILRFFTDERDLNIHTKPARPGADYHVRLTENLYVVEPLPPVNPQGDVVRIDPLPVRPGVAPSELNIEYHFRNWQNGSGEVLTLCGNYLSRLQSLVKDGQAKGYLT
jgi:hypothetical protein